MPSVRDSLPPAPPLFYKQTPFCKVLEISEEARFLQRLFSTFPGGLPGLGLLLLRAALGITALVQGVIFLNGQFDSSFRSWLAEIAAIVCGVSMLLGFLTPVTGALLFAGGFMAAAFLFSASVQAFNAPLIYGIILSVAIIFLGPGAFSVDALLFGRREIFIPKN